MGSFIESEVQLNETITETKKLFIQIQRWLFVCYRYRIAVSFSADRTAIPLTQDMMERFLPPGSAGHFLGTDELGRDVLSRVLISEVRCRFTAGVVTVCIAIVIGTVCGIGYVGGIIDDVA